ncbi:aldo/keto reductase [Sphingobium nicotianae]|uniref:Aldo/keto reductase n=1 Tax=Sphingobium nicotianae TaxID=2782607 RepID=A0A9X1IPB7_9SPHN|nr:aldo/keto reductase [Sphingobium nicotianae]MBT2186073.1 aldo/keto reductase [Sphingobium nicotianae]
MRYNRLGKTGLYVSELALGTATFGGGTKMYTQVGNLQQAEVDALVRVAIDAGVNLIDTADVYAEGISEQLVGQALRNLGIARSDVVLATKVSDVVGDGPNDMGTSRYHICASVEASLRRLQVEHIDLYQLHDFDFATPIEETVEALDSLVRRGLIRYVGVSNWTAWQLAKARGHADRMGLARYQSHQAYYSLVSRDVEREVVPFMAHEGMGMLVWGPLAGGSLTGKYRDASNGRRSRFDFPPIDDGRCERILTVMDEIVAERGVTHAQLAISWLLHQPIVDSVLIGATSERQLKDNLASAEIDLTSQELERLGEVSALPSEYPAWMQTLKSTRRRELMAAERNAS